MPKATQPQETSHGFRVAWKSPVMPVPAFAYFDTKAQAQDYADSLDGQLSPEEYRRRWL